MLSVATTKFDRLVFLVAGRLRVSVQVSKVDACATGPHQTAGLEMAAVPSA